jgi:hypothetical protein
MMKDESGKRWTAGGLIHPSSFRGDAHTSARGRKTLRRRVKALFGLMLRLHLENSK